MGCFFLAVPLLFAGNPSHNNSEWAELHQFESEPMRLATAIGLGRHPIKTTDAARAKAAVLLFRSLATVPSTLAEQTAQLKARALAIGFDLVGVAPAVEPPHYAAFRQWIADGCHAGMEYLVKRAGLREHPSRLLPEARSVIVVAMNYAVAGEMVSTGPSQGEVARFARGLDYHQVIRGRLHLLAEELRRLVPDARCRATVDSAPMMERDFAQLAGLGWFGKNTTLITEQFGSWVVLGALITTAELTPDVPMVKSRCGSCRACLDACPTGALVAPYRLDARKCLSYWTIEHQGPIPNEMAERLDGRVFGCDACQQACPHNRNSVPSRHVEFQPRPGVHPLDLQALLAADESRFSAMFPGSPLLRTGWERMRRNALTAIGQPTIDGK